MKKYKYNGDDGKLYPLKKQNSPDYTYCIAILSEDESLDNLIGQEPLVFKDHIDLVKYLNSIEGKNNMKLWTKQGYSVLIERADIYAD